MDGGLVFSVAALAIFLHMLGVWYRSMRGVARYRFVQGRLAAAKGRIDEVIKEEFCEVARLTRVSGVVIVKRRGGLAFKGPISKATEQQFRNVFYIHYE